MATTTPDNLFSPDGTGAYNIPVSTAAMQDSVQAALTNLRANIPALGAYRTGTNAQRLELTGMTTGVRFWATDTKMDWVYDGAKWLVAPGQVLASMDSTSAPTTANALIGTVISVSGLSVGQKLKIISSPVGLALSAQGVAIYRTSVRNNASPVTATTADVSRTARAFLPAGAGVSSAPGASFLFTTTNTGPVTAAMYNGNGLVYGADGQSLWIESA